MKKSRNLNMTLSKLGINYEELKESLLKSANVEVKRLEQQIESRYWKKIPHANDLKTAQVDDVKDEEEVVTLGKVADQSRHEAKANVNGSGISESDDEMEDVKSVKDDWK